MNHSAVQRNGNRFGRLFILCSWLMTALLPEGLREPSDRSSPSPAGAAQARSLLLAGPAGRSGRASRVHCCGSRVGNGWLVLRDGQAAPAGPAGRSGCASRVHCCGSRGRRPGHDQPARQSALGYSWLALRGGQAAPAGTAGRSGCVSRVHCCGSRSGLTNWTLSGSCRRPGAAFPSRKQLCGGRKPSSAPVCRHGTARGESQEGRQHRRPPRGKARRLLEGGATSPPGESFPTRRDLTPPLRRGA